MLRLEEYSYAAWLALPADGLISFAPSVDQVQLCLNYGAFVNHSLRAGRIRLLVQLLWLDLFDNLTCTTLEDQHLV